MSGADEKIVRVFDAPKVFLSSLKKLCGVEGLGDEVRTYVSFFIVAVWRAESLSLLRNRDQWQRTFHLWVFQIELLPVS